MITDYHAKFFAPQLNRESSRLGQSIRWATQDSRKLLLTATPLQNSLLELYGLSTLIDENLFGELSSFRTQYINYGGDNSGLRERLISFCWRTLRSQVFEFVKYTERKLITRPFKPTDQEHKLYVAISNYLKRDATYALPFGQKHLLILIIRKVLASSPHAVASTLETIKERLTKLRLDTIHNTDTVGLLLADEALDEDLLDMLLEDEEDNLVAENGNESVACSKKENPVELKKLDEEIEEINRYILWARSIGIDTKSRALIKALEIGFKEMDVMGAESKVLIFTESRRTQTWLKDFLEGNGYTGRVLTFNGTNKDEASNKVYQQWLEKNKETGLVTCSKQVDIRAAILDRFKKDANILIATEAGAECLNLQFCSAIINFDLPWNPQRIEQRIGRCHRYGQKHDVVVINFLNEKNEADRRVYELLEHKFKLFSGVFGVSDEVLGTIESGVDFEKRVLEIDQECRNEEEIKKAFLKLQHDLEEKINIKMQDTRKLLLEHFDEDVHQRLKINLSGTHAQLDKIGQMFWAITRHILKEAFFDDENELLLFSGFGDDGNNIDQETAEKLFNCDGTVEFGIEPDDSIMDRLSQEQERYAQAVIARNLEENCKHFAEARDQLDKWAEDMELAAQRELDDIKRQIRDLQRRSRQASTLEEQHDLQEEIGKLERKKRSLREKIFDVEDEITTKRDRLIESLEQRMKQKTTITPYLPSGGGSNSQRRYINANNRTTAITPFKEAC